MRLILRGFFVIILIMGMETPIQAQDPGAPDTFYFVPVGKLEIPLSGGGVVKFQCRFKTDNTGPDNGIAAIGMPIDFSSSNSGCVHFTTDMVDTTEGGPGAIKFFAGSAVANWSFTNIGCNIPFDTNSTEFFAGAITFSESLATGDYLFGTLELSVNCTTTLCFDTAFRDSVFPTVLFTTSGTAEYAPIFRNDCFQIQPQTNDDTVEWSGQSPIDLLVTDPIGRQIGLNINTIGPEATYDTTQDKNLDGDNDDIVRIFKPLVGEYDIQVIPEPGTPDTATYTLAVRINGNDQRYVVVSATVPPEGDTASYNYQVFATVRGDMVGDNGEISPADVIFLINAVLRAGYPKPNPEELGDVTCNGIPPSPADVVYLINYVFRHGPPPCS